MKLRIILLSLSLFFILFLSSCDNSTDNPNNNVLWPLAKGNYWVYERYFYNSSNVDSLYNVMEDETSVDTSFFINNTEWFLVDNNKNMAMRNQQDGLWVIFKNDQDLFVSDSAKIFMKYPTKIGDNNQVKNINIVTSSINYSVNVPAGVFNCIHYQLIYLVEENQVQNMCFAPGIGMVKTWRVVEINETVEPPDTVWIAWALKEYHLK